MHNRPTCLQMMALYWLKLPYFPFQKRIIRKLFLNRPLIVPVKSCLIECYAGDYISNHLLASGIYEDQSIVLALSLVTESDVFVDAGANIGLYTILLTKKSGCRSVAFEPNHDTFQRLYRNVALNHLEERVTLIPCALSNEAGVVTISLESPGNVGGSSMIQQGRYVNAAPALPLSVALEDLDISNVKLLKIDVEGAENLVLLGTRLSQVEHVIMEWHGTAKASRTDEFLKSEICRTFFSEFDVFDMMKRPAASVEVFMESNVYLRRKSLSTDCILL